MKLVDALLVLVELVVVVLEELGIGPVAQLELRPFAVLDVMLVLRDFFQSLFLNVHWQSSMDQPYLNPALVLRLHFALVERLVAEAVLAVVAQLEKEYVNGHLLNDQMKIPRQTSCS